MDNHIESLKYAEKAILEDKSNKEAKKCICYNLFSLDRFRIAEERINAFLKIDPLCNYLIELREKILNKDI